MDFALPSRDVRVPVRLLVDQHEHRGVSDRDLVRHFLRLEPPLVPGLSANEHFDPRFFRSRIKADSNWR
jgi:hypothetical protein